MLTKNIQNDTETPNWYEMYLKREIMYAIHET